MESKIALTLRTKKLGVLIRDTRLAEGKSLKECGEAIGASSSTISSFEKGKKSPSLPELEMLSHFLNVPISRFWKDEITSDDFVPPEDIHIEHELILRDRHIGEILKEARDNSNLTYKEIKEELGITPARMRKYERGESLIQIPILELLCSLYKINISDFFDPASQVGQWIISQNSIEDFLKLPFDLQAFASKPINRPYLELAQRLSALSTQELRAIAEGLLEITI